MARAAKFWVQKSVNKWWDQSWLGDAGMPQVAPVRVLTGEEFLRRKAELEQRDAARSARPDHWSDPIKGG